MAKRLVVWVPLLVLCLAAWGLAQGEPTEKPDLQSQLDALKAENQRLKEQVDALDAEVQEALAESKEKEASVLDRFYSILAGDESVESGFIRKGDLTGTTEKLLNINLFLATRYMGISNRSENPRDSDGFSIPFARLHLTGQAFTNLRYTASFEFSEFGDRWLYPNLRNDPNNPGQYTTAFDGETLMEAALTWSPDFAYAEDLGVTAGLTRIFLSPAGMEEPWQLDFIEYPQIVYYLLPPGLARDVGAYAYADFLPEGRLKFWLGAWNGAHRNMPVQGYNDLEGVDAWGGGGDHDALAVMGRAQVNVLDEENWFLGLSGGLERTPLRYREDPGGGSKSKYDLIYDLAGDFRFLQRTTWLRGEFIHTRVANTNIPTMKGYYLAVGHRLDYLSPHFELLARYDRVQVDLPGSDTFGDTIQKTLGVNYYFDPEHKHDAKVQLNWVDRKDGPLDDHALMVQFVLGF